MRAEVSWTQHHCTNRYSAADGVQCNALQSPMEQGPGSEKGQEEDLGLGLADMRVRLLAGIKRYLHGKRLNGLLSSQVHSCYITTRHPGGRPGLPLHPFCAHVHKSIHAMSDATQERGQSILLGPGYG